MGSKFYGSMAGVIMSSYGTKVSKASLLDENLDEYDCNVPPYFRSKVKTIAMEHKRLKEEAFIAKYDHLGSTEKILKAIRSARRERAASENNLLEGEHSEMVSDNSEVEDNQLSLTLDTNHRWTG